MSRLLFRAAQVVAKLPFDLRQSVASAVGNVAWCCAGRARRAVTKNVEHVLGQSQSPSLAEMLAVQKATRHIFCSCVHNYVELFASLPPEEIADRLDLRNVEYLEEALALGRGVVLFSAHLGPFEVLSSWFSAHGYRLIIPVERMEDNQMLQLMIDFRRRNGVEFVPAGSLVSMRKIFKTLQDKQIVLITADRAIAGKSKATLFFGARTLLPTGPVNLSVRTGAPLVGAFGWRTKGKSLQGEFTRLSLALPDDQRRNEDALQDLVTQHLEKMIRSHIDQWVVFEPLWDINSN